MMRKFTLLFLTAVSWASAGAEPAKIHTTAKGRVIFEYQPVRDDKGKAVDVDGEPVTNYVPDNARLDDRGLMEVRTNLVIRTSPPVRDAWLGDLVSSKRSEQIVPLHVVTDHEGRFRTTIIGKTDQRNESWGTLTVSRPESAAKPRTLAELLVENRAATRRLQREDAPLMAHIAFEPVDYYACNINDAHRDAISIIPAFRFQLPRIPHAEFQSMEDPQNGKVELSYLDRRNSSRTQKVIQELPENVKQALHAVPAGDLSKYMWYSERNTYVLEDGAACIRIPREKQVAYKAPAGTTIEATSPFPRGKILLALVTKSNVQWLQGIDLANSRIQWEFPIAGLAPLRLMWMSGRFALSACYGRKSGAYDVIDLAQKKIVKSGTFEEGDVDLVIGKSALLLLDRANGTRKSLFTFPR